MHVLPVDRRHDGPPTEQFYQCAHQEPPLLFSLQPIDILSLCCRFLQKESFSLFRGASRCFRDYLASISLSGRRTQASSCGTSISSLVHSCSFIRSFFA